MSPFKNSKWKFSQAPIFFKVHKHCSVLLVFARKWFVDFKVSDNLHIDGGKNINGGGIRLCSKKRAKYLNTWLYVIIDGSQMLMFELFKKTKKILSLRKRTHMQV